MTASEDPLSSTTLGEKKANVKYRFRHDTPRFVLFPFSSLCCHLESDDKQISPFRRRDRRGNFRPPREYLCSSWLGLCVASPSQCAARRGRAARLSDISNRVRCVHFLTPAFDSVHGAHSHRYSPVAPLGTARRPPLGRRCSRSVPLDHRFFSCSNLLRHLDPHPPRCIPRGA